MGGRAECCWRGGDARRALGAKGSRGRSEGSERQPRQRCACCIASPRTFLKLGASATVKFPLPQYSSSRSPSVLPSAAPGAAACRQEQVSQRNGEQHYRQWQQRHGMWQAAKYMETWCWQAASPPSGGAELISLARTCRAARPAEHVLAHAAVGLAEVGLHLQTGRQGMQAKSKPSAAVCLLSARAGRPCAATN